VGETNRVVYVLQLIWIPGVFREPNIGWNPIIEQMFYKSIGFVTKFEDVARRLETSDIPTPVEGSSAGGWWGRLCWRSQRYSGPGLHARPRTRSLDSAREIG